MIFNRRAPTETSDRVDNVKTFQPDAISTDNLLSAAGLAPSRFDAVGFKLFGLRLAKEIASVCGDWDDEIPKVSALKQQWEALLKEAEQRSHRNEVIQQGNTNAMRKRKANNISSVSKEAAPCRKSIRLIALELKDAVLEPPKKRYKSGKKLRRCAKTGCSVSSDEPGVSFHRLPPHPDDPHADASMQTLVTYWGKRWLRTENNDRCGRPRGNNEDDLRVCSCHPFETTRKAATFNFKGKKVSQTYDFTLVTGKGMRSSGLPSNDTKGVGIDRYIQNQLNYLQQEKMKSQSPKTVPTLQISSPTFIPLRESKLKKEQRLRNAAEERTNLLEEQNQLLKSELAAANLRVQQVVECHSAESEEPFRIPSMEKSAQFVPMNDSPTLSPQKKRKFGFRRVKRVVSPDKSTQSSQSSPSPSTPSASAKPPSKSLNHQSPPQVLPNISDGEVKRRTGFPALSHMLAYIIIIVNGDIDHISRRVTALTWFEEWFFFFEWKYHQTLRRQEDLHAYWGINHECMNNLKDSKLRIELGALLSWPKYATYEEDLELRDEMKWSRFNGTQPIFWDITNVMAV